MEIDSAIFRHQAFPLFWVVSRHNPPPSSRSWYICFRLGILPVAKFTSNWKNSAPASSLCLVCHVSEESIELFLFFCPGFRSQRKRWLIFLCKALGILQYDVALRICRSDKDHSVIFSVVKYLESAWHLRKRMIIYLTRLDPVGILSLISPT